MDEPLCAWEPSLGSPLLDEEEVELIEADEAVLVTDEPVVTAPPCDVVPFPVLVLNSVGVLDSDMADEALPADPPALDCADSGWESEDCPSWFKEAMADLNFIEIGCRDGENVNVFSKIAELVVDEPNAFLLLSKLIFWIISSSFLCSSYT